MALNLEQSIIQGITSRNLLKIMSDLEVNELQLELRNVRLMTVFADRSNDKGVIEQEVVHIRYVGVNEAINKAVDSSASKGSSLSCSDSESSKQTKI
jgi:hypothetical protein